MQEMVVTRSSGDKGEPGTETESEDTAEGAFAWEDRSDRDVEELKGVVKFW